jgi:hypothetical protein
MVREGRSGCCTFLAEVRLDTPLKEVPTAQTVRLGIGNHAFPARTADDSLLRKLQQRRAQLTKGGEKNELS